MEMQDKIKLALAGLVVAAGVVGFYLIPEGQDLLRALAFIVSILVAAGVVWASAPGKGLVVYANESIVEARKVVWPTRKEATQVTLMVFVFVAVLALFMWLVDSSLSWLFYDVILGRGR
ncbi:preprotein translocase subunit SecE [Chromobacterium subtsugae]|uniref:Protein translocase subunit SecE n=1 Tax=Chromobacterium subtsugae TaxID=251747 RepID=A0ABS7F950_9NEIS|nr:MULTISPECIES: preprotein translocase subunit SecE [Chromobacterium]MBW7564966.1 preprotein translocase subunit SecE [Chromobacterium subtsugae]MBW8286507.1 preprotein translocase subunit SecE [Chromobacterium subtsugae]WSE91450.1 preprotein translocase subunit SecE [Chromobacterium subtsugae]WVH59825.1 preprotein translocase subunit SecE [Chromobacterium subtsugae]